MEPAFSNTCQSTASAPIRNLCNTAGRMPGSADFSCRISPLPVTILTLCKLSRIPSNFSVAPAAMGASRPCMSKVSTPLSRRIRSLTSHAPSVSSERWAISARNAATSAARAFSLAWPFSA